MTMLSIIFFFLRIRRPPRSTLSSSSAASDVYKRQSEKRWLTRFSNTFKAQCKKLRIAPAVSITRVLTRAMSGRQSLGAIKLSKVNLTDADVSALAFALRDDILVRSLDISHNLVSDQGASALAEMLCLNSTLTAVNLSHNRVGLQGGKSLARAISTRKPHTTVLCSANHPALKGMEAELRGQAAKKASWEAQAAREQPNPEPLSCAELEKSSSAVLEAKRQQLFSRCSGEAQLCNKGLTRMYPFQRGYSALSVVDVSHNQLRALEHLPSTVRSLDASHNLLSTMNGIQTSSKLVCLRLNHNHIRTIEHLEHMAGLKELSMAHNPIKAVGAALHHCASLEVLNLAETRIESLGTLRVVCGSLSHLSLEGSPAVQVEGFEADVHRMLPRLCVLNGNYKPLTAFVSVPGNEDLPLTASQIGGVRRPKVFRPGIPQRQAVRLRAGAQAGEPCSRPEPRQSCAGAAAACCTGGGWRNRACPGDEDTD
eukprot:TRINITY_DN19613_c0_g1_i1.p1 TRINITY_DN19613_c0_g1~~TRINITY_DN19613_c0_g1_i1.p1  ORF type:complete len:483 (+),score=106.46 TRINITY_DN19613_c0_g1_i1:44-1492(+)